MKLKELDFLGLNKKLDQFLLPEQYALQLKPHYSGNGIHNVAGLESLCRQFEEYCHQQAIIKQRLIDEIKNS